MSTPSLPECPLSRCPAPAGDAPCDMSACHQEHLVRARALFPRLAESHESGTGAMRTLSNLLVEDLYARWELPSVYMLVEERLRCQAFRGYFQVSDGFPVTTGVIGRVVRTGKSVMVEDVNQEPQFIAAIPGLRGEACAPIRVDGRVVGAVSLETTSVLDAAALTEIELAAWFLGVRIQEAGGLPEVSMAELLGRIALELSGLPTAKAVVERSVSAACEISGMSSASLVRRTANNQWQVAHSSGPLAEVLGEWEVSALGVLRGWVSGGTSSYFPDWKSVPEGYEFRIPGIEALSIQPLVVGGVVEGMLLTADALPRPHDPHITTAMELLASQSAVTLAMMETMRALSTQALQDPLTGLPNRRRLLECLEEELTAREAAPNSADGADSEDPAGAITALVLLDLDGFKSINDRHGHPEGDELLRGVALRLRAGAQHQDEVCRLGGDEFAVVVREVHDLTELRARTKALVGAVSSGSKGTWHPVVGASAGVRVLPRGAGEARATPSSVLVEADAALYAAKRAGRGRSVIWEEGLAREEEDTEALVADLRRALRQDELTLAYQPIMDIHTGVVTSVEALARWEHPERGPVPPTAFVAAAERAGMVRELTRWVLETALRQTAAWPSSLNVSVNISAAQLTDTAVVDDVRIALALAGVAAERIVLEVTETSAMADIDRAKETLEALAELGVALALDDFGTGYSSLTHAHELPFDTLKIDRTFVAGAARGDKRAIATISAVCALASPLGVGVVAEGVETLEELAGLARLGCTAAQGFALSRPVAPEQISAALAGDQPWRLGEHVLRLPREKRSPELAPERASTG